MIRLERARGVCLLRRHPLAATDEEWMACPNAVRDDAGYATPKNKAARCLLAGPV